MRVINSRKGLLVSVKDHTYLTLLLILVSCILVVAVSSIFHQLSLLYDLVLLYWGIWTLLWGIPLIYAGVKEVRKARRNGERILWRQNKNIIQGVGFALPPVVEISRLLGGSNHQIGKSGWLLLNIFEITLMFIFLVPLLFFEVVLTAGFIRSLLNKANPYAYSFQSISTEEQTFEEQNFLKQASNMHQIRSWWRSRK